jgi:two-component system, sensor histidine kinase and response regulator
MCFSNYKILNGLYKRVLILLIGIIPMICPGQLSAKKPVVKIGVLARRGKEICLKKWVPTADYLSRVLPDYQFQIVPLDFEFIFDAIANKSVDFILTNPSFYIELEIVHKIIRIATLKSKGPKGVSTTFGGVVFTLKSRKDIRTYKDIKGKTFMAVKETSFGGWRTAWREFKWAGIDPYKDFGKLMFGGTHDNVVFAVKKRKVDAGTVRTGTLESMHIEGKIDINDFYVIHEHYKGKVHLPYLHSTREYPEWPMAKVAHTSFELAEKVSVKLIEMPSDSKAAKAANCTGWTIPLNYQPVHDCLKTLKVGPYKNYGKIYFKDVLKKYSLIIILFLTVLSLLFLFSIVFIKMNLKIRAGSEVLKKEIIEHKFTAKLLEKAKKDAEIANNAKSSFLANMSHEIRTPMNSIIGMSHLCLGTQLTVKQRDYISNVYNSGELLLQIINDILDVSKIESGKMELEEVPFMLDDVLTTLSKMLSLKAHEKGLEIVFDIDPGVLVKLVGDPLRLGQILLNLVSNAVKFTKKGEIVVKITPEVINEENIKLLFLVKDTGIGLTKEQSKRLFEPFTQADTSTTRKFGGTGLGLSISKFMVEQMEGKIWVESEFGRGSRFYFSAEFRRESEKIYSEKFNITANLDKIRVLVVDDMESVRQMFKTKLESFSVRVNCVASGKEALSALKTAPDSDPYNFIIIDNKMPGLSGIETLKQIKNDRISSNLSTIIMVNEYDKKVVMKQTKDIELNGFLIKPVLPSCILDVIVNIIGGTDGAQESRNICKWIITGKNEIKGAKILLVDDNKINQMVGCEFLDQLGLQVKIVNNGKEAVEIIQNENFDAVLMDIQMPVMGGYEATKIIREKLFMKLPIIALTANAMSGDNELCITAGMNDYMSKPIDPQILLKKLAKWIPKYKKNTLNTHVSTIEDNENHISLPSELYGIDMELGLLLTGGRPSFYIDLLCEFVVEHGDDSLKIDKAIKQNDKLLVKQLLHSLKGVAGGLGAKGLQKNAKLFESAVSKSLESVNDSDFSSNLRDELNLVIIDITKKIKCNRKI